MFTVTTKTLRTIDNSGTAGADGSLKLRKDGVAVIAYDNGNAGLRLAVCADQQCSSNTNVVVDNYPSNWPASPSLELYGNDGLPVISYYYNDTMLRLVVCYDVLCSNKTFRIIDSSVDAGQDSSLVLSSVGGNPTIAYYDATNTRLKLAVCYDRTCLNKTLQVVDGNTSVGIDVALTLTPAGFPAMSYFNGGSNNDLKYAVCFDSRCLTKYVRAVDTTDNTGHDTSIAITAQGNVMLAYRDYTRQDLKYTFCNTTLCTTSYTKYIDGNTTSAGFDTSLAINYLGNPVISYLDATNVDLKMAVCSDALCTNYTLVVVDATGYVGYQTSMQLFAGKYPVISYYDYDQGFLKLVICADLLCAL